MTAVPEAQLDLLVGAPTLDSDLLRLPALSVRGPWWWFILHAGKRHENRDWPRSYRDRELAKLRQSGGRFLLHAAKGCTRAEFESACVFALELGVKETPGFDSMHRGGVVGHGVISGFVTAAESGWFVGPGALVISEIHPVPFYPCRGALGFFYLPRSEE